MDHQQQQTFSLLKRSELRIYSLRGFSLCLTSGFAEMFGQELVAGKRYDFGEMSRLAVYTFHGCEIRVDNLDGEQDDAYISHDLQPMKTHLRIHRRLQLARKSAGGECRYLGPRVVIVGPLGSGKSSLWKTLCNWAYRLGHRPIGVDLDVSYNHLGLPGALTAADWTLDEVAKPSSIALHFGHLDLRANVELYESIVLKMAMLVEVRMDTSSDIRESGFLVNTCGWIEGRGYKVQLRTCLAFGADHVIVIGDDRLYSRLKSDLNSNVEIVLVPRSTGAIPVKSQKLVELRNQRIKEYFYGTQESPLLPHRFSLQIVSDHQSQAGVKLYQIGESAAIPTGCIPFDVQLNPFVSSKCVSPFTNSIQTLENRMVAVSFANEHKQCCYKQNIVGYVLVEPRKSGDGGENDPTTIINVLAPAPLPLPSNLLVVGDVVYSGPDLNAPEIADCETDPTTETQQSAEANCEEETSVSPIKNM